MIPDTDGVGTGSRGITSGALTPSRRVPFASLMQSLQSMSRRDLEIDREAHRRGEDIDTTSQGPGNTQTTRASVQDRQELAAAAD